MRKAEAINTKTDIAKRKAAGDYGTGCPPHPQAISHQQSDYSKRSDAGNSSEKRGRVPASIRVLPGRAGDRIERLEDIPLGTTIDLRVRVSTENQKRNGDLDDQLSFMVEQAEKQGLLIRKVIAEVRPGWDLHWLLDYAENDADPDVVLVVESTDRLVRSEDYSKHNQDRQATEADLDQVFRLLPNGCRIASYLDPDAPWEVVRSHQTQRGMKEKSRPGGRPRKAPKSKPLSLKRRRLIAKSKIVRIAPALGWGPADCARFIESDGRTEKGHLKTVCRWFDELFGGTNVEWVDSPFVIVQPDGGILLRNGATMAGWAMRRTDLIRRGVIFSDELDGDVWKPLQDRYFRVESVAELETERVRYRDTLSETPTDSPK